MFTRVPAGTVLFVTWGADALLMYNLSWLPYEAASLCDDDRYYTHGEIFVKSGGCTDNAEKTTKDMSRQYTEIGESPLTHPKAKFATRMHSQSHTYPVRVVAGGQHLMTARGGRAGKSFRAIVIWFRPIARKSVYKSVCSSHPGRRQRARGSMCG